MKATTIEHKQQKSVHRKGPAFSFMYALRGLKFIVLQESNFRIQLVAGVLALALAALLNCSMGEWILVLFCCAMVLAAEAMNSVVEELVDWIHPDFHSKAGKIKDMAAAVPFIASVFSLICGLLIFVPKVWKIIGGFL